MVETSTTVNRGSAVIGNPPRVHISHRSNKAVSQILSQLSPTAIIRATTDDVEKRKEIARSKRATHERIENGYDHGRPPFGLTDDDSGYYWILDRDTDEYRAALACIRLRENGHSWREIARETSETSVNKDTARRIYARRERYQPSDEHGDDALETVR